VGCNGDTIGGLGDTVLLQPTAALLEWCPSQGQARLSSVFGSRRSYEVLANTLYPLGTIHDYPLEVRQAGATRQVLLVAGPGAITTGGVFYGQVFFDCTVIITVPSQWNVPQGIQCIRRRRHSAYAT